MNKLDRPLGQRVAVRSHNDGGAHIHHGDQKIDLGPAFRGVDLFFHSPATPEQVQHALDRSMQAVLAAKPPEYTSNTRQLSAALKLELHRTHGHVANVTFDF